MWRRPPAPFDIMMLLRQHLRIARTTLTLDDVVAKLRSEARDSGRSFRDVVNEAIRKGLLVRREAEAAEPFHVEARDLGELRPGLSLDNPPLGNLADSAEPSPTRTGQEPYGP